jgi:hypothetical protein
MGRRPPHASRDAPDQPSRSNHESTLMGTNAGRVDPIERATSEVDARTPPALPILQISAHECSSVVTPPAELWFGD